MFVAQVAPDSSKDISDIWELWSRSTSRYLCRRILCYLSRWSGTELWGLREWRAHKAKTLLLKTFTSFISIKLLKFKFDSQNLKIAITN